LIDDLEPVFPKSLWITAVAEGMVDEAAIRRLAGDFAIRVSAVHTPGGKHRLDRRLRNYNAAARFGPWLVLRDLDHDASCPAELIENRLPVRSPNLMLRIAVRSIEAWLLADHFNFSRFFGIPDTLIPADPEALARPKRTVVDLARRSRRREIRNNLVPAQGLSVETGAGYSAYLTEFINKSWTPASAAARSDSLRRCLKVLKNLDNRPVA
jgi:hypothetical protein